MEADQQCKTATNKDNYQNIKYEILSQQPLIRNSLKFQIKLRALSLSLSLEDLPKSKFETLAYVTKPKLKIVRNEDEQGSNLKTFKMKYLSNHWMDIPENLILCLPKLKIAQNDADIQWHTTSILKVEYLGNHLSKLTETLSWGNKT
jgi:hypothetical protein